MYFIVFVILCVYCFECMYVILCIVLPLPPGTNPFAMNNTNIIILHMKTYVNLWQYLAEFLLQWEVFQTKVPEKIKTHILCSITCFRKSFRLWDNVEKYGARRATDDIWYRTE
jgi:hypothetical protein